MLKNPENKKKLKRADPLIKPFRLRRRATVKENMELLLPRMVTKLKTMTRIEEGCVRRLRRGRCWRQVICQEPDTRTMGPFFNFGIMANVVFNGNPPPVAWGSPYNKTGEVAGVLYTYSKSVTVNVDLLVRVLPIVFDRDRRVFHQKGDTEDIIESADILILYEDGSSLAGWLGTLI